MFSKRNRLNTEEFEKTLKSGERLKTENMSLFSMPNQTNTQISVTIPKKVEKGATKRNKIKRKLVDFIKKEDFPKEGLNLIFMVNKNQETEVLKKETKELLDRIEKKVESLG